MLIVPTIFGVNAFARGFAESLAHAGLTAAVCDLYSGQPLPANYEAALAQARKLNDQIIDDIETRWLDHLQRGSAVARHHRLLSRRPLCPHPRRAGSADQGLRRRLSIDR